MSVNPGLAASPEQIVGSNLRERRKQLGLTQDRAGQLIGGPLGRDWSRQTMSIAESGGRAFTAAELVAMAHALDTTVAYFFEPPLGVAKIELPKTTIDRLEIAAKSPQNQSDDPVRWLVQVREHMASLERVRAQVDRPLNHVLDQVPDLLKKAQAGHREMRELEAKFLEAAWHALAHYEDAIAKSGQDETGNREESSDGE